MEWLTICIAMAGALVVLTTRPCWGLAAYLASLMWYPEYLRINIGAEFSAPADHPAGPTGPLSG